VKKGIVMEINKDFLTLLTPDGEFLRAFNHNKQYQIGQEIDFFPVVQEKRSKSLLFDFFQSFKVKAVFSVALLFIITIAAIFPFYPNDEVYAYMSIDVNPSIELGVNEKFQVIEILPYNEDGKRIIANIHDWKKKNIHVLTSEIVREMKEQGFINNNHAVLLTTVSEKEAQLEKNNRWKKEMAEIKDIINNENLELKVFEGSIEERAIAKEKGMTTGQYKENQLKANKSTSHIKEKMNSNKPSTKEYKKDNEVPFGQVNKNKSKEKQNSSGQAKEKENTVNQVPPGQAKKIDSKYHVPPGQAKKNDDSKNNQNPPGQEKKKDRLEKENSSEWKKQDEKKVNKNNDNWKNERKQDNKENKKYKENHQGNNANNNKHQNNKENKDDD